MSIDLRYGMVGGGPGGNIGAAHREALIMGGEARLAAGSFSRSREKNIEMARSMGIDERRCYSDYRQMAQYEADRPDGIQFVVVVTPNNLHYEICKAFLEAGIHVACEKPITTTLEEAMELEAIAKAKGLLMMVAYTYTGHHMFRRAKDLLADGAIGRIRKVVAEYPQSWLAVEGDCGGKQGAWRCDPSQNSVNCLGDIGVHIENAVSTMTGLKIKRVLADMTEVVPGRALDDDDVVMLEYTNGVKGVYWSAQHAFGHENDLKLRIFGSNGALFWELKRPTQLQIADKDNVIITLDSDEDDEDMVRRYGRVSKPGTTGWKEAMSNIYHEFILCIRAKQECRFFEDMATFPTAADGVGGLRFIQACLESNQNDNRWVDF